MVVQPSFQNQIVATGGSSYTMSGVASPGLSVSSTKSGYGASLAATAATFSDLVRDTIPAILPAAMVAYIFFLPPQSIIKSTSLSRFSLTPITHHLKKTSMLLSAQSSTLASFPLVVSPAKFKSSSSVSQADDGAILIEKKMQDSSSSAVKQESSFSLTSESFSSQSSPLQRSLKAEVSPCLIDNQLSFERFCELFRKEITERVQLPDRLSSIDNYVKYGQPKDSLTPGRIAMRKNILYASFSAGITNFYEARLHDCHDLYVNAAAKGWGSVPVIIGDHTLPKDILMLQNFGAISGSSSTISSASSTSTANIPTNTRGGINCEGKWDLIKNDMFMLGAMSSNKSFYVYKFGKLPIGALWNNNKNEPHVLFREICFLIASGYTAVSHSSLGIGFEPSLEQIKGIKASVSYSAIRAELKKFKSQDDVIQFAKKHSIPIAVG